MRFNADEIFQDLVQSYNQAAEERDQREPFDWKLKLRQNFLHWIKKEKLTSLIDIGAGTGIHGKYFQDQGITVTCLDLSPVNIAKCFEKGLKGQILNILELDEWAETFDSAFAMNSLLHIPFQELPRALSGVVKVLNPGGLFFWGQYGGQHQEGVYQDDRYQPKRFFSLLEDHQIQQAAEVYFKIEEFQIVHLSGESLHFQSLILRNSSS